jgi:hypothetical protein
MFSQNQIARPQCRNRNPGCAMRQTRFFTKWVLSHSMRPSPQSPESSQGTTSFESPRPSGVATISPSTPFGSTSKKRLQPRSIEAQSSHHRSKTVIASFSMMAARPADETFAPMKKNRLKPPSSTNQNPIREFPLEQNVAWIVTASDFRRYISRACAALTRRPALVIFFRYRLPHSQKWSWFSLSSVDARETQRTAARVVFYSGHAQRVVLADLPSLQRKRGTPLK